MIHFLTIPSISAFRIWLRNEPASWLRMYQATHPGSRTWWVYGYHRRPMSPDVARWVKEFYGRRRHDRRADATLPRV